MFKHRITDQVLDKTRHTCPSFSSCHPFLAERVTSAVTSAIMPRSALPQSGFATTVFSPSYDCCDFPPLPSTNLINIGKQPGHESNSCPLPRTTEAKQCYHCQGLGHVQADCPTLRLTGTATGGRCYSCGQPGHLAVRSTVIDFAHFVIMD